MASKNNPNFWSANSNFTSRSYGPWKIGENNDLPAGVKEEDDKQHEHLDPFKRMITTSGYVSAPQCRASLISMKRIAPIAYITNTSTPIQFKQNPIKCKESGLIMIMDKIDHTKEDWDTESSVKPYNPEEYCKNNPIIRQFKGISTKSVRKKFRKEVKYYLNAILF